MILSAAAVSVSVAVTIPASRASAPKVAVKLTVAPDPVKVSTRVMLVKSLSTTVASLVIWTISVPEPPLTVSPLVKFAVAKLIVSLPVPKVTLSSSVPAITMSAPPPVLMVLLPAVAVTSSPAELVDV